MLQVNGFFITFEGTDGSGKTSVLNAIEAKLKTAKVDYLRTREPGGNRISEQIRNVILDKIRSLVKPHFHLLILLYCNICWLSTTPFFQKEKACHFSWTA